LNDVETTSTIKFKGTHGSGVEQTTKYTAHDHNILLTDYENFALVHGCGDILGGFMYYEYAILLSRDKYINADYVEQAKDKLTEIGYDWG
jgi:hypothetical protein